MPSGPSSQRSAARTAASAPRAGSARSVDPAAIVRSATTSPPPAWVRAAAARDVHRHPVIGAHDGSSSTPPGTSVASATSQPRAAASVRAAAATPGSSPGATARARVRGASPPSTAPAAERTPRGRHARGRGSRPGWPRPRRRPPPAAAPRPPRGRARRGRRAAPSRPPRAARVAVSAGSGPALGDVQEDAGPGGGQQRPDRGDLLVVGEEGVHRRNHRTHGGGKPSACRAPDSARVQQASPPVARRPERDGSRSSTHPGR